jgi:CHAD domain-containing protein
MNSDSSPSAIEPDPSLQPEWQRQVEAWRGLLAQCARKPSRKRVHALRRLTLRLRVAMDHGLQEQARDSAAARAVKRWKKEGKNLRRALEPVRDADVYMARLDGLRNPIGGALAAKPEVSQHCLREIDKLAARLEAERQSAAEELVDLLAAHSKRLNRRSQEMEESLASAMPAENRSTAQAALIIFAELTSAFPALDGANLHAYRKRLKHALYLAEISAATDPLARRLAAAFRKIHLAAGEWHDWQTLAQKTRRVLPSHGKQDGLAPALEALAQGALKRAVGLCRHTAVRFLTSTGEIRPLEKLESVRTEPASARRPAPTAPTH